MKFLPSELILETIFAKIIHKEINLFEVIRDYSLEIVYLLTIPSTSMEPERRFW